MIAYDHDMRQLFYRKRERLPTAKNRIASQDYDWPGELHATLRFNVRGLQGREVIVARTNLRLPVKCHAPAVAKPINDGDCSTVFSPGTVTDIDDKAAQVPEIAGNYVHSGGQFPLANALQLKQAEVTEGL